ncbi:MAG: glutamine amidotransferase [Actinomycetota bacterium]|nr:MAG: glutamine amidotransferase [Actinomycetota bacterium]
MTKIRVVSVFPDLLGTYGDSGNALVVSKRLALRGFEITLVEANLQSGVPADGDFYLIGGGEDGPQARAAELLSIDRLVEQAMARGAAVLAVCAGFQIMGTSFLGPNLQPRNGIGIFDCVTHRSEGPRSVGELIVEPASDLGKMPLLTGYENHQGVTELLEGARPLGKVLVGNGNNYGTKVDGAIQGRAIGTYMHGPVFARNPGLCDFFISLVLGPLEPIDDPELTVAHERLYSERIELVTK